MRLKKYIILSCGRVNTNEIYMKDGLLHRKLRKQCALFIQIAGHMTRRGFA